ncbi:hypothetical protein OnM2_103032 [Erysiphe neolycopersici]|uniref:Uncharacterized protein n=1 Tax=Erysiphe neolycopersici TaxID=212602 RepID=A0A420H848_9PEZI|nr:hypothetical protein OnM2_103032 [Erysiphe neolycopersici]
MQKACDRLNPKQMRCSPIYNIFYEVPSRFEEAENDFGLDEPLYSFPLPRKGLIKRVRDWVILNSKCKYVKVVMMKSTNTKSFWSKSNHKRLPGSCSAENQSYMYTTCASKPTSWTNNVMEKYRKKSGNKNNHM